MNAITMVIQRNKAPQILTFILQHACKIRLIFLVTLISVSHKNHNIDKSLINIDRLTISEIIRKAEKNNLKIKAKEVDITCLMGDHTLICLNCLPDVLRLLLFWLSLTVTWVGLQCVIVVFPGHTRLLFIRF